MKRALHYLLVFSISLLTLIVVATGGVTLYVYTHQEEIKQLLVKEINKNLLSPVTVQKIDISVFKNFPLVSLQLKEVRAQALAAPIELSIPTYDEVEDSELFYIEDISLSFNVIDIYKKNYVIKKITVNGGKFNLIQYDKIHNNYIIWKTSKSDTGTLSFRLSEIRASNTFVRYRQLYRALDAQITCKNVRAKGELYGGGQSFDVKGEYGANLFETDSTVWVRERSGDLDIHFSHDSEKGAVFLTNSSISINKVNIFVDGNVFYNENIHTLDLVLSGNKNNLGSILSLLPAGYTNMLIDYESTGIVDFSFNVKGDYSKNLSAYAKFDYSDGSVTHIPTKTKVENIFIEGEFSNGDEKKLETSTIKCGKLRAEIIDKGAVTGTISVTNFLNMKIDFDGTMQSDLTSLFQFLGLSKEWNTEGKIDAKIRYTGGVSKEKFKEAAMSGKIKGTGVLLERENFFLKTDSTVITLNDRDNIEVGVYNGSVSGYIGGSGSVSGGSSVSDSTDSKTVSETVSKTVSETISAKISSVKFSIENVFSFLLKKETADLKIYAKINAQEARWNKIYCTNLSTDLYYFNNQFSLKNLQTSAFDGSITADAKFNLDMPVNASIYAKVENINISNLFKSFDNFEQETITDKNISGILTSDFVLKFGFHKDSGVDAKSILFDCTVNIKNGNLKNMESLRSIARFTGQNDLQNIHFSEISNTFSINKRVITIPSMRIKSDVADFDLSGTHTFDNYIDYRVNLELSDMLSKNFKKRKNKDEEFGVLIEEQKERVRLPLHVFGHIDSLSVKYDFKQSAKNFNEKAKEERKKTQEILKQEFNSTPKQIEDKKERQQWKEQEKGKFVFEKEDQTPKTKPKPKSVNQFTIEQDD
ncbi:MAG: hypothetical protein LBQ31_00270 [Bacteroidales bacterium]|nr:hypothetical protein [Bacteroidales bacterium]